MGNPFRSQATINDRAPFTDAHFERWLQLFYDVVELGWTGPNVDRALTLAHNVARVHSGQLVGATASTGMRPAGGGNGPVSIPVGTR